MKQLRLAPIGILALAAIIAIIAACSSDGEQTSPQQAEQSRTESNATEQPEQRRSTEQAEQDRTASDAAEQSEQPQSTEQAEQDRTASNATEQSEQSEQSQSSEQAQQDRTEPNAAEQAEQQQAQQSAQQQADDADSDEAQVEQSQPQQSDAQQEEMTPEQEQADAAEQQEQQEQEQLDPAEAERLRLRAEEISANATVTDVVGINAWLNGEETSVALELAKGNIVLVDFWTYTCINCVRTLPFLTAWDEKYRNHGLVIIGIHSPEFAFEERLGNVQGAIDEYDIEYLVAIDNDHVSFRTFQGARRFWPRKYLIGPTPDGSPMGVLYDHIGEGDYHETEIAIRQALEAGGRDLSNVPIGVEIEAPSRRGQPTGQTRELYMGWRRNSGRPYAGQDAYYLSSLGAVTQFVDVASSQREHNRWYLEGLWQIEEESIVHARQTDDLEDYVALIIRGRTVNLVLTAADNGQPYDVFVEIDGRWLFPNEAGAHIQWDDQGRSFIRVTENDLYRLLFLPEWSQHELKLSSDSDQFRLFAFTFGSYVGGE
ncbi:MAG: redoxin domain-containing protein [Chloroflexi bacterium]|nr:redoxin domain-containing protein [Chloroflexota bacterium]